MRHACYLRYKSTYINMTIQPLFKKGLNKKLNVKNYGLRVRVRRLLRIRKQFIIFIRSHDVTPFSIA